jgi:hypothetical protein
MGVLVSNCSALACYQSRHSGIHNAAPKLRQSRFKSLAIGPREFWRLDFPSRIDILWLIRLPASVAARSKVGIQIPEKGRCFPTFLSTVKIAPSEVLLPGLVARAMLT